MCIAFSCPYQACTHHSEQLTRERSAFTHEIRQLKTKLMEQTLVLGSTANTHLTAEGAPDLRNPRLVAALDDLIALLYQMTSARVGASDGGE